MQKQLNGGFHVDGLFAPCFRTRDGKKGGAGGNSHEVVESKWLVTTHALQDEHGNSAHQAVIAAIPDGHIGGGLGELLQVVPTNVAKRDGHTDSLGSIVGRPGRFLIESPAVGQRA